MGYSLCMMADSQKGLTTLKRHQSCWMQKMVNLGVLLQLPKTCEKRLYNYVRVDLSKKKHPRHLIFEKSAKLAMRQRLYLYSEWLVWV